jgi:hypothetical protein|tara:strand:- start:222 stop:464 length:243 start_codon:yes stop_codon:yes gene_type:complete
MTLEEFSEAPELDRSHHLTMMMSLPINDRITFEEHEAEVWWQHSYEFAQTILNEVHTQLGITPPSPEEFIFAEETVGVPA